MSGLIHLGERHNVLTMSQTKNGVNTYGAGCTEDGCDWFEAADGITEAMKVAVTHNPRCEVLTQHERVPLGLSCQRMALHKGDHEHTVRWS